jgi:uncharacterized protein
MILENIYDLAYPQLKGKKIKDVRIGLGLMAVELDDGSIGVTYVLREEIGPGCTTFSYRGNLIGTPAEQIARWALGGKNVLAVAMGQAVLNSVAEFDKLKPINDSPDADATFSVEIRPDDIVGVIGFIGPVIANMENRVKQLFIFERGEKASGRIHPESDQPELLPKCQVVFISSSSLINGTLDNLLKYCANARDVVMVGSSTPMYPAAFSGSGITVLAGTRWLSSHREEILAGISQGAGIKQLIQYGQKISVKVNR